MIRLSRGDGARPTLLEDRAPLGTPEHARHVTEILLAAHESSRTGQRISLRTRF